MCSIKYLGFHLVWTWLAAKFMKYLTLINFEGWLRGLTVIILVLARPLQSEIPAFGWLNEYSPLVCLLGRIVWTSRECLSYMCCLVCLMVSAWTLGLSLPVSYTVQPLAPRDGLLFGGLLWPLLTCSILYLMMMNGYLGLSSLIKPLLSWWVFVKLRLANCFGFTLGSTYASF